MGESPSARARCAIGNDVEIGANTTIDRGTLKDTVIEDGVRLDNLIQMAHNVRIGAHTAIAALVGIAGSTTIGKHCVIAGKVGIARSARDLRRRHGAGDDGRGQRRSASPACTPAQLGMDEASEVPAECRALPPARRDGERYSCDR